MWNSIGRFLVVSVLGVTITSAQQDDPLDVGRRIIDRVMKETSFSLSYEEQKPVLGIEVVDFSKEFCGKGVAYGMSYIASSKDTTLQFGISAHSPVRIAVNGHEVLKKEKATPFYFRETGYGIFEFNDTVSVWLHKGVNPVLVKSIVTGERDVVYLREMTPPEEEGFTHFTFSPLIDTGRTSSRWMLLGLFREPATLNSVLPPDTGFSRSYAAGVELLRWKAPSPSLLVTCPVSQNATYKRESYSEWNYPNGIMMWSILNFGKETGELSYQNFAKRYCDFTEANRRLFSSQVTDGHAFRGFNYRIDRKSMLDDAGSPTLPFAEFLASMNENDYKALTETMVRYVRFEQTKLPDGTLCRIEPEPYTVWADDLFMSAPLLLRYASYTHDRTLYDFIAGQVIHFNKYLCDPSTGLYSHGYFVNQGKRSDVLWSRSNGWMIWAISEVLLYLPLDHKEYGTIKKIFQAHVRGLMKCQDADGMWHQVLTDPATYEESSSTAMFIIALARGAKHGWIDKKYSENALRAWDALQKNISEDGVVSKICRGTGLSNSSEYYAKRQVFLNDPRGLGAVITACREISHIKSK